MQISRAGKKATLQQHQMEIGYICLFICKYYLPPHPHGSSWPTHTYVRKHLAITLCCFCCWCHSWRRSIGIYKKEKNTAKNTFVFFGNFQFKLWLNFARTNAKVATVQILGIYSNLLISRIKCRNRRRVSHKSCLAPVFRVLPARYLLCKFIFDYLLPKICFRLCKCVKPKTNTYTHTQRPTCSAARR